MKKVLLVIIKTLLFLIGWGFLIGIVPDIPTKTQAFLRLWWEFIPFLSVVIFTFLFVYVIEKNKIKVPFFSNFFKNSFIGFVAGILWLGIVVAILVMAGLMKIEKQNTVDLIYVWIVASFLNVVMQELLLRGYIYQLIKDKYCFATSIIVTTIMFTAIHGGAFSAGFIPVVNVVTMSVFVTLLLEYTGTLLAPVIVHFIWNTFGAIILGGVSLATDYPHLLNSIFKADSLLSGGEYKIEGSIIVLFINLILIAVFSLLIMKKKMNINKKGEDIK